MWVKFEVKMIIVVQTHFINCSDYNKKCVFSDKLKGSRNGNNELHSLYRYLNAKCYVD